MAFFQCFTFKFTTSNLFANSNMLDPKVRKGLKKKYYGQKYMFSKVSSIVASSTTIKLKMS